jgi:hypothetical protein
VAEKPPKKCPVVNVQNQTISGLSGNLRDTSLATISFDNLLYRRTGRLRDVQKDHSLLECGLVMLHAGCVP